MKAFRMLVWLGAALVGTFWFPVQAASAANTATFRDCSFTGGLDPDFVELSGAMVDSQGKLTVTQTQNRVTMKASESADPGDSSGHDTFTVTVRAPNVPDKTLSGSGIGSVVLSVPLAGAAVGSAYTISWSATFDNGNHSCPSAMTPQNTASNPFVLDVVANSPTSTPPTVTHARQSNRVWRERGAPVTPSHKLPVGTAFSFILNEEAGVSFAFTQSLGGRKVNGRCVGPTNNNRNDPACTRVVTRGTLSFAGHTGLNRVSFKGRLSTSNELKPGRYTLVITAKNASGQRSQPRSLRFRIVK
jgi:hypothetical protein